jgi:8-oxo-dGTP diphosphatase
VDESAEIQELLVQLLTVLTPELAADLAAESPETFEKLQQVLKELHPEAAERLKKSDDHQARFVRALHEVAREHHLDQRDKAYWQCNDFSHAAKRVADEHGVPAELWSSTINFDQDNGEIKAGETVAHTFLKIGDQFHDYTASQATAALPHPFVGSKPSRYHLDPEKKPDALQDVSAAHSDPGSKFWYDAINAKMGGLKKAELEKGSMRRKAPFDPRTALTDTERDHMADWQGGPAIEGRPFHREQLTRMEGNARVRALHRLSGVAQTKLVDGKRLFLLHRGMSPQEHDMTVRDGRIERPWSHSSWTPRESLANNFANPYIKNPGKLVSAWIHEDDIHTIPKQFGGVDAEYAAAAGHQKNRLANEHEVVVRAGHSSEIHQVRTAEKPTSWSSDRIHDAPRNLDDKINIKGAQEQKDRKLFGKSDVLKNLQALQKSLTERLEKTRGRIVMPGLSNMTRPDQQIRTIATPRQEKIAAHVLANQTIPGASADNKAALSNVIRDHHIKDWRQLGGNLSTDNSDNTNVGFVKPWAPHFATEHEAFHHLIQDVRNRHGQDVAHQVIGRLVEHIHPDDRGVIEGSLGKDGYNPAKRGFREEIVNRVRDVLHSPEARATYKDFSKLDMPRLKQSWDRMREDAKQFTPEMFKKSEPEKAAPDNHSEVASVAVRSGSKLLMGRRRDNNRWTLAGGHLDQGEEHREGAARELFEETGIRVDPARLHHLTTQDVTTHSGKKKRIHGFVYEHRGETPTTHQDPDQECESWEWIDVQRGLPDHILQNLHSPRNVVLEHLGLLPREAGLQKTEDQHNKLYSPKDVLDHENRHGNDLRGSDAYDFYEDLGDHRKYRIADIPLKDVEYPHSSESYDKPLFLESDEDEQYAHKYSKLTTPQPPVVLDSRSPSDPQKKYKLLLGRHRTRAAYLAGRTTVRAFVPAEEHGKFEKPAVNWRDNADGTSEAQHGDITLRVEPCGNQAARVLMNGKPKGYITSARHGKRNAERALFAHIKDGTVPGLKKSETLEKSPFGDQPAAQVIPDRYDYSAMLPEQHADKRLRVHYVREPHGKGSPNQYEATLIQKHPELGDVTLGTLGAYHSAPDTIQISDAHVTPEHRGQGFGKLMYEALYHQAAKDGVKRVTGAAHTKLAGNVHASLAEKHGFQYEPSDQIDGRLKERLNGPYGYQLPVADRIEKAEDDDDEVYWHGSPSGELHPGKYGIHLGTREAAKQALEARIGTPAVGEWDGTREYGKTLLAGQKTMRQRKQYPTGYSSGGLEDDHYPSGKATYSDGTQVPLHVKPEIAPYRLVGPMSNSRHAPHEDFKANGMMAGQLKRGTARRGYYYKNVGEDAGSISIVVPHHSHVKRIDKLKKSDTAYDPEQVGVGDFEDAYDHYARHAYRNMESFGELTYHGDKMRSPDELIPKEHLHGEPGWLKKFPKEQWAERFESATGRDAKPILAAREDHGSAAPGHVINGLLSDGYARTHLAHALGEKVLVSEWEAPTKSRLDKSDDSLLDRYSKLAHQQSCLMYPVTIRGVENFYQDLCFHITLKSFNPQQDPREVLDRMGDSPYQTPVPEELGLVADQLVSAAGNHYYVLKVATIPTYMLAAYNRLDGLGIQYPEFRPHITIDKVLYDEIREKDLKPQDLELTIGPLEYRVKNEVVRRWGPELAKSEEELQKMPFGDVPAKKIRQTDNYTDYDYSKLIPKGLKGYGLVVGDLGGGNFTADLTHEGKVAGRVSAHQRFDPDTNEPQPGHVEIHSSGLSSEHHGKGLGRAMYEALYHHVVKNGFHTVVGDKHTEAAERVHRSIAKRHGIEYKGTPKVSPGSDYHDNYRYELPAAKKLKKSEPLAKNKILKIPLSNGLEAKVHRNPTEQQAHTIHSRSKDQTTRYFAHPDGDLYMWDAFDLSHGDVMEHLGVEHTSDNYAGAGTITSHQEARDVARRFREAAVKKSHGFKVVRGKRGDAYSYELPVADKLKKQKLRKHLELLKRALDEKLEKAKKPGWPQQGYRLSIEPAERPQIGEHFTVHAHTKSGERAGSVQFFVDTGKLHPEEASVNHEHQRKGLATAMYDLAEIHAGQFVEPSDRQTPDAQAFWEKRNARNGKDAWAHKQLLQDHMKGRKKLKKSDDLEKGKQGDWEREGYTLHHTGFTDDKDRTVAAHAPDGSRVGEALIDWHPDGNHIFASFVRVDKDHRRKGLATAMYRLAEELTGAKMIPSSEIPREQKEGVVGSLSAQGKALWSQPNRPFGKSETDDLAKAIDSKAFRAIHQSHRPDYAEEVDHTQHLKEADLHPDAKQFFDSQEQHRPEITVTQPRAGEKRNDENGISTKLTFPEHGFMIKPYHREPERDTQHYAGHPTGGWATIANRNLYRAAGIGHLNEDVEAHQHEGIPVTAHRFHPDAARLRSINNPHTERNFTIRGNVEGFKPKMNVNPLHVQQLGVMDFLTGNIDRHTQNVMVNLKPNQQGHHELLSIDADKSFHYHQNPRSHRRGPPAGPGEKLIDHPAHYVKDSALGQLQGTGRQFDAAYPQLHQWYGENRQKITQQFTKDLGAIKNPFLRHHIEQNFSTRMATLDKWHANFQKEPRLFSRRSPYQTEHHEIMDRPAYPTFEKPATGMAKLNTPQQTGKIHNAVQQDATVKPGGQ